MSGPNISGPNQIGAESNLMGRDDGPNVSGPNVSGPKLSGPSCIGPKFSGSMLDHYKQ